MYAKVVKLIGFISLTLNHLNVYLIRERMKHEQKCSKQQQFNSQPEIKINYSPKENGKFCSNAAC